MVGYIYLIQNIINKKCYVGKTYRTVKERFKQHCRQNANVKYNHYPLYKAFKKYSIENFIITELGQWEEVQLELMEQYYIKLFDSFKNGYNATLGGDGRIKHKFTKEDINSVILTTSSICEGAKTLNVSNTTFVNLANKFNIPLKIGKGGYKKHIFTFEQVENAIKNTKNTNKASKLLGIDYVTYCRLAKEYGLSLKKGVFNFSKEQIEDAINTTNNIKEAYTKLGVTDGTLRKFAKLYDIQLKKGQGKPSSHLTNDELFRIKYGKESPSILSKLFNIHTRTIYRIRKNITYSHI